MNLTEFYVQWFTLQRQAGNHIKKSSPKIKPCEMQPSNSVVEKDVLQDLPLRRNKMKRQSGFTLIELITVIVILGILSAFAVPRFANLESDARSATIDGLAGSLRAGAALAHALWLVDGGAPGTVTMEGQDIDMDATTGYPAEAAGGIDDVIQDLSGFDSAVVAPGFRFAAQGVADAADCSVSYDLGAVAGDAPTISVTNNNSDPLGDCN